MSGARAPWWLPAAAALGALALRALGATWRVTRLDDPAYAAGVAGGERFVYALWHARMLVLAYAHRHQGAAILVSRHRDGELISRVLHALGYVTARGSSTRGGGVGGRELLARAAEGRDVAITPDGPRGPAERMKPGVARLARRTGRRIVPVAAAADAGWVLGSWDRFRIPRPFARVVIAHGAPLPPPPDDRDDPAALDACERALARVTAAARARAGERP